MLDGRGPYTFVLDSGGDYIVTPDVAQALQAKSSGGLQLGGVGSATEGAAFTHVDSIAVGDAVVRNQYCLVLPIATGFGMAEGMRIDGMVGYQFLARFLTTIDYADSKLTLAMPPSAPAAAAGAAAIPFYFDRHDSAHPYHRRRRDDDRPKSTPVAAPAWSSRRHSSRRTPRSPRWQRRRPASIGFGVGGPSTRGWGEYPRLQIGPYTIPNSDCVVRDRRAQGAFADPFNPGQHRRRDFAPVRR